MQDSLARGQTAVWRKRTCSVLASLYLALIFLAPAVLIAVATRSQFWTALIEFCAVPIAFLLTAGLLAQLHCRKIVEGRFPLDTGHPSYFHRRLYGLCWTCVYYSGPIYYLVLSIPLLKKLVFRLFGYRGNLNFTVYPDTWLRDLPLLEIGEGAYLSNKATIGTNMIFFRNGQKIIEVGRISLWSRSLVGHLTVIGPGTTVGSNAQIGVVCGIGRRVSIGDNVVIGDDVTLDHGAKIESGVLIPTRSYIAGGVTVGKSDSLTRGQVVTRKSKHAIIPRVEELVSTLS